MQKPLSTFNDKLKENLMEMHWRQWSALGAASQVRPEQYWVIDLEALIISTLAVGPSDKRLLGLCVEWIMHNNEWLNTARFKRITGMFTKPLPTKRISVLPISVLKMLKSALKKQKSEPAIRTARKDLSRDVTAKEYGDFFNNFTPRGIAAKMTTVQAPALLQLLLRGYYGMDARSDLFIYLLFNKQDNSLSIARNIFYNQKNIYNILEKWAKTGLVVKMNKNYVLKKSIGWRDFWNYEKQSGYLNWPKAFYLFDRIFKTLLAPPWRDDAYLMSSFMRDVYKDADEVGGQMNVEIPDPKQYKGALYFDAFAGSMMAVLEKILSR